jgi:tetratricopeptide (TPR) repeat protein
MKKLMLLLLIVPMVSFGQMTGKDYYLRGYDKINSKDYYAAVADFTKAIELSPDQASTAYYGRAVAKNALGDYNGAEADASTAIKLDANFILAYNIRGLIRSNLKDNYGAISDFTKVIDSGYDDVKLIELALTLRASMKSTLGDHNGACSDFKKAANMGNLMAKKNLKEICN